MNEELKNDIWEAVLKDALILYSEQENRKFKAEIYDNVPNVYKKNMKHFIIRYKQKQDVKRILKNLRKMVAVFFVIFGMLFTVLLGVKDIRAVCVRLIHKAYDRFVKYNYYGENKEIIGELELKYLPDGYELRDFLNDDTMQYISYSNKTKNKIDLLRYYENCESRIDNDNHDCYMTKVNGKIAYFWRSKDAQLDNILIWENESGYFELLSTLKKDEMIKIAENVKIKK